MSGEDDVAGDSSDVSADAARRLLERLRELAASLDDVERRVLASLIGPGMARLARELAGDSGIVDWDPDALPSALDAQARLRPRSIRAD